MNHLTCQQIFVHNPRFVFSKEKTKSAPESAEREKNVPSYEHLKKEVARFAERIDQQFKDLEKHYNVKIDRTKFDGSDAERYKKANMSPEAVKAVGVLVLNLVAMREALKKGDTHRGEALAIIRASVTRINVILKRTSEDALYGYKKGDPLAGFAPQKMGNIEFTEENKPKAEGKAPEIPEATPEELFQSALSAFVEGKEQSHDAKALLDIMKKRGTKHLEEKMRGVALIIDRSTDGKSVRVQGVMEGRKPSEGEAPGVAEIRFSSVVAMDSKDAGTKQFETPTYDEETQKKMAENKEKFAEQVEQLKKAPVGSQIIMEQVSSSPTSARFQVLRKMADGSLKMVLIEQELDDGESVFDKDARAVTKDIKITDYDLESSPLLVGSESALVYVEADENESKHQARQEIAKLAKTFASTLGTPQAIVEGLQKKLIAKIRTLALANGIDSMDPVEAKDPIGKQRYLRIAGGKIEWGEVKEPKKGETFPQYVAQRQEPLEQKAA